MHHSLHCTQIQTLQMLYHTDVSVMSIQQQYIKYRDVISKVILLAHTVNQILI